MDAGDTRAHDTRDFVADLRIAGITAHVAQTIQPRRGSAIDVRTVRHSGYGQSINARRRIEQVFRWIKQGAGLSSSRPEADPESQRCSGCMWWPST